MKPKLILIRGLPGSGKSTLAQSLVLGKEDWEHHEADMYFINYSGKYEFDPSALHSAHNWCQENTYCYLLNSINVVVSNTFTTLKELKPYFLIAKEFGIVPSVVHCQHSFGNIHDVPQETIDKMKARWQNDVSSLYELLEK